MAAKDDGVRPFRGLGLDMARRTEQRETPVLGEASAGEAGLAREEEAATEPAAAASQPAKGGTAEIAVGALLSQARRASDQGDEFSASLKGEWAAALEGRLQRQRETQEEKAARVGAEAEARAVRAEWGGAGEGHVRETSKG